VWRKRLWECRTRLGKWYEPGGKEFDERRGISRNEVGESLLVEVDDVRGGRDEARTERECREEECRGAHGGEVKRRKEKAKQRERRELALDLGRVSDEERVSIALRPY
jgi:hypothetical protein